MIKILLKLDWIMLISSFLLLGIGLLSLYSISVAEKNDPGLSVFSRQCIFIIPGMMIMVFFASSNYHYLRSYSTAFYFATTILLLLVLIWGSTVRGTVGWIGIGQFHIQPVEIAKLSLIIFLASFISKKRMEIGEVGRVIVSLVMTLLLIFLVLKQPDFGSAMVLAGIWLGMMIISGISRKTIAVLLICGITLLAGSWFLLADYQKDRIFSLIQPDHDPKGSGYNVIQARIAVGSGGLTGKGIGHGSQSQLNFLPEKHNDFIFAVVAEELGLLGSSIVLVLFLVFLYRLRSIALRANDNFGYLLVVGIMLMFFIQITVNIGMNIGIMPVTGISLPFLSYGGSYLVIIFASLGIILNVSSKQEALAFSEKRDYTE